MSEQIDNGGPAFPVPELDLGDAGVCPVDNPGMTLRDYFAAAALQGWLASFSPELLHPAKADTTADIAADSYTMADAMLAARKEKP